MEPAALKAYQSWLCKETYPDVAKYEAEVEAEKILLLPIPTQANKVSVTKAVTKLLKEVRFTEGNDDEPKYEIENVKVDVKGLAKALLAYDMKQKGKDILEIGLTVRGFDKKEFADWDRVKYNPYEDDYFMHQGVGDNQYKRKEWNEIPKDWVGMIHMDSTQNGNPKVYI